MYRALTRDIEVTVEPFYLEEQSDPEDDRYVWGYRIVISNNSDLTVRLVNRYWNITDQNGVVDEVTRCRGGRRAAAARPRRYL
jgi:ApaG protein